MLMTLSRVGYLLASLLYLGCGERLVDASYRGESLFTLKGSIEPDQYIDGASLVCTAEGDTCYDNCYESYKQVHQYLYM